MPHRHRDRLTILRLMSLIAVAGGILSLLAANRRDLDVIALFLVAALVIVLPVHLAIEANRRDAVKASLGRANHDARDGTPNA